MKVNVIDVPHVSSFDYLAFPEQNPVNQAYLQNRLTQFSHTLTDMGSRFIEQSRDIYNKIWDDSIIRAAKAAVRVVKNIFQPDSIYCLKNIEELRSANLEMQRYVMANPVIRQAYLKQTIDGYSDTYSNTDGDRIGNKHYDYRKVMTGIVNDTDESWEAVQYIDEERNDRPLDIHEKVAIHQTWEIAEYLLKNNEDPTDIRA